MCWSTGYLVLAVLLCVFTHGHTQTGGTISFAQEVLTAEEGTGTLTPIQIPLVRDGDTTGAVVVSLSLLDPDGDFFTSSIVTTFPDGGSTASATAVVVNDNLPEGNETFTLTIVNLDGAERGPLSSMQLIITASDEPFGLFQFDTGSLSTEVAEPISEGGSGFVLTVLRGPGTFGTVTLQYQIVPSDPSSDLNDISPSQGQLTFAEGSSSETITLFVTPDNTPEPSELLYVQLMNPSGGGALAAQNTQASVTILTNDAPISWAQELTSVDEDTGLIQLSITRGILADGSMAGDLTVESTVQVTTNSASASSTTDFDPISQTLTFAAGVTSMSLPVTLVDDDSPEGDEMFTLILSSPSPDAVLSTPSITTVLIRVNDDAGGLAFFASPGPVVISEDEGTVGSFIVRRTVGTFGNLTAEWRITSNQDGSLATSDFAPAQGTITILDGAVDAILELVASDDSEPEVSESFTVELVRVISEVGGLSDSSPRLASLILSESDDVYGLLEWADDSRLAVAGSAPRELMLALTRTGDSVGIVAVDYSVVYVPPEGEQSQGTTLTFTGSVQLQGGQTSRDFSLTLPDSTFLETGGNFMAVIDNATLVGGAIFLVPPVSSPSVGERSQVMIPVPVEATSGFISFAAQSLQVTVSEPDSSIAAVSLNVSRIGSFGTATITWTISASSSTEGASVTDLGSNAGLVVISNGENSATFSFTAVADDIPEVDEQFLVTLITVNEPNQMILTQQNTAVVTILANDDPSGVFSISNSTRGPYLLDEEDNRILVLTISRSRGDLTRELIRYDLIGEATEIAGGQGIADFQEGVREVDITLFVTDDDVPEVNETFQFVIMPLSVGVELLLPSTVDITVLANDNYAGVFSFNSSSLSMSIVEPGSDGAGADSRAELMVMREAGAFGVVDVEWEVDGLPSDLTPTRGVLTFAEGQRDAVIVIMATPDNDPEADDPYNVQLSSVNGDARLASSSTTAVLTILQNDDPIRFSSSLVRVEEGDTTTLALIRGGQANGIAEVMYSVSYGTASPNDVSLSNGVVSFAPGQMQASIMLVALDDTVPEEEELLMVTLVSVSGDAVLVSPGQVTVIIELSDDPNGVFAFADDSLQQDIEEGDTVLLTVERSGGSFGSVSIRWMVYLVSLETSVADVADISPVSGVLSFSPGYDMGIISLTIHDDTIPEVAEMFQVELSLPTLEGESMSGARLDNSSIATLLLGASDDPHGVVRIADVSTMVTIAEDVPPDDLTLGQMEVMVDRVFGTIGSIRVLWEVYPLTDLRLPGYVDLLFFGERGVGVVVSTPRPNTATSAFQFSGVLGSVVTVPMQYHPENISAGFTISLWLQPSSNANGMLVAKTSGSGVVYALSLVSDGTNFLLRLTYQQSANREALGMASAEVSFPQADLVDGAWHSLVVAVGMGSALFYKDNTFIDSRTLLSSELGDEQGELTVGGQTTSNFYTGTLQDVRIYQETLQPSEVEVLSADAAAASLSPISGYITYSADEAMTSLSLTSIDDDVPEPSAQFVLSLTNIEGGARVSASQDSAIVTVLKSDSSNGIFGFTSDSSANVIDEPGSIVLSVNRSEGTFDDVSVTWEVREAMTGTVATQDFAPATGRLEFVDGQDLASFVVMALDETVPELEEDFLVVLTSAITSDNQTSSTGLSGASIAAEQSQSTLTVTENDFPYGVIQFSPSAPSPGQTIITATLMPEVTVLESDGTVTVYVVRAQGTLGSVSAEFFTSDGTALNMGLSPDYTSNAGLLTFADGVTVQSFDVVLIDDSDPELEKTFFVNLTNPQGGAALSEGQTMTITIQPSDDAFGRFSFSSDSLSHIVAEQSGVVTFSVVREGGTFGAVSVYWEVMESGSSGQVIDISPATGEVVFTEGQTQQQFSLTIADDLDAELMEVFTVQLVNVSVGASITSVSTATITVQASDHPYGRFVFSPALRPLEGVVESGRVEVVVTRQLGAIGQVMVDVETVSSDDLDLLNTELLDLQALINDSQIATTDEDYDPTRETLIFDDGETSKSFCINITSDSIPEIDEYLFAVISQVELVQSSLDDVDTSVLPSVVPGDDSLAILIIAENDDARGIVQFSEGAISTSEPAQDFITLQRTAGMFGDLSVQWEAVPGTAGPTDYAPQGGVVIIPAGVSTVPLPVVVSEDIEPEFSETFVLSLVRVSGGGIIGGLTTSTITILANDDPNGAFEFSAESRTLSVEEPEDGAPPTTLTLTVQRVGGTVGVVSVSWRVIDSNGLPSVDVLPVSGILQFTTDNTQQPIQLTIPPDMTPELDEVFDVELVNATGGGNLGDFPVATITIPANDGPYGIVSFTTLVTTATEVGDSGTTTASLTLTRSVGVFGDIRVLFNVESADAAILALANDTPLLSYFDSPISNVSLEPSALLQQLPSPVSLNECGTACLSDRTCQAFSVDEFTGICELYLAIQSDDNTMSTPGMDYYQKLQERALPFYQSIASDGNDFTAVVGQSVIIADGESMGTIPVTIIGDTAPELNESLVVTLVGVELVSVEDMEEGPVLGAITEATVVILENDDPRGLFTIAASDGSAMVRVVEPGSLVLGITLTVERLQGTIGPVDVTWSVTGGTALPGQDFIGTGATLVFDDGDSRSTIALLILADDIPEIDETVVVSLGNPTGGARVDQQEGMATVVIDANDGVAGVVGLSALARSAVVREGEDVQLEVVRGANTRGMVEVDWIINGTADPALEFINIRGTNVFQEGESSTFIVVQVRADATPELAERYTLTLTQVRTISDVIASGSGTATLDSQASMATITISANNNPHGEVAFSESSLSISTEEGLDQQLTIIRLFGTFGAIDVTYGAANADLDDGDNLASAGMDFTSDQRTTRLEDGQQSAVITVPIIDDSDPELDEVFLVRLLSVALVSGSDGSVLPSVGVASVARVTIIANDSPRGTMTFMQNSYTVEEEVGTVDIVILREQGTIGQVSVVYFITSSRATSGQDFVFELLDDVVFVDGQENSTLSIPITNDSDPEVEEDFCVGIRLPRGGAILGNITSACVTILPNDDAYGVFGFAQDSLSTILEETQTTPTAANVAELRVERTGGAFEQITIPFEVAAISPEGAMDTDLSLASGALFFNQDERFVNLRLEAVMDEIPELAEMFLVTLGEPNLGRLSSNDTDSTIEILPNQSPQGVFQIVPVNTPSVDGRVLVEEDIDFVEYQVIRSLGTFGEVTVVIETTAGTAISTDGEAVSVASSQAFPTSMASVWYSFVSSDGDMFLCLGSPSQAVLYGWRGVFTPVQVLPGNAVTGFASFSPSGEDVLVVANGGTPGNREVDSHVYRFTASDELTLVQSLATVGAADVVWFQASETWYVVIANGEDNAGIANVDSVLYRWNGASLEQVQLLATRGASAMEIFTIDTTLYLVVASLTDTRSQVFIWANSQFRLDHTFDTSQATDVTFLSVGPYLLIAEANGLSILTSGENGDFATNLTLPIQGAAQVEGITQDSSVFVVTSSQSPAQMFIFQENTISPVEVTTVSLPISAHALPFATVSGAIFLATAGVSDSSQELSIIYEIRQADQTTNDFYSRNLTLTFGAGESSLLVTAAIFNDDLPEVDEDFVIGLSMPSDGATLGEQAAVTMTILTNDNAHGLVGFTDASLSVIVEEMASNTAVTLQVERTEGTFGLVTANWELSGGHMTGEITPASGQVTFSDGVSLATISLLVLSDDISELNEVTTVTLTNIALNGVPPSGDPTRGAGLAPGRNEAVLTVQANDVPHGEVGWTAAVVMAVEEEGENANLQLFLVREFGAIGAIVISYSVGMDTSLPTESRAESLQDFIPTVGNVVMGDGDTSATINVTILHDNIPEPDEGFLVSITGVQLTSEADRQGSTTDSPRVSQTARSAQVVIGENDDNRGLLTFRVASVSVVEEFASQVILQVDRTRGTFGDVSVQFSLMAGSAVSADYSTPPESGVLIFGNGEDTVMINIDIVDDQIPEEDETFRVVLINPMNGAEIGSPSSVDVTILGNDDINGVFFFGDSSLLIVLSEGADLMDADSADFASLTVERATSLVGVVTVFWEVDISGTQDLEPTSGNLTFAEGVAQQEFTIQVVEDGLPEGFEAFPVRLISILGGGRLVDPQQSQIAIQASDDPTGVLALQQFPEGVLVNEGEVLVVGVVRTAGTSGTVTLTWDITPPDATVFVTISDTIVLVDGQQDATITIQTLSDDIPETTRSFTLQVVSVTVARVDVSATRVEIVVPASNNPHGSVELSSTESVLVAEGMDTVQLSVVRSGGLIGALLVNFTILPNSALDMDISVEQLSVVIPSEMSTGLIEVDIIEDTVPELDETFTLRLTSVDLLDSTEEVTILPTLGTNTEVSITILASDDPFGSVSISQDSFNLIEGETLTIPLIRVGGTVGVVTVSYATLSGRAVSPDDYAATTGNIVFASGETTAQVLVTSVDDDLPEIVENFEFILFGVTGGSLGNITRALVLIGASDSPFGVVGFNSSVVGSGISIANPIQSPALLSVTVTRMGGTTGNTDITWSVESQADGQVTSSDIALTSGTLSLVDGQSSGTIVITVLPLSSADVDEQEESFTLTLTSTTNNVLIDPALNNVTITIQQNGSPLGVVSFLGDAIRTQRVTEGFNLSLPLARDGDLDAGVDVSYVVTRVNGDGMPVALDVTPVSGTVTFPVLQSGASIALTILTDSIAEIDEMFNVTLSPVTAGISINPQASTAMFIINSNGILYGEFSVVDASLSATTVQGTTTRYLNYTITRVEGDSTDTNIFIQHSYSQDSSSEVVPALTTQSLPASSSQLQISLAIPQGSYLTPGSFITVSIANVTVSSPAEAAGLPATVSPTNGIAQVTVTDQVANIAIGFTAQSLIASVDEGSAVNNVEVMVFRRGELGSVQVTWTTGTSTAAGFVPGSFLPATGILQFPMQQNITLLTLTASPALPHGVAEVFEVSLSAVSMDPAFPSQVDSTSGRALVEPMGVFQIPASVYSAQEGTVVSIPVWRRFGSMGTVVVTGVASAVPPSDLPPQALPAIATTDFSTVPISLTFEEGVTSGTFDIPLQDNGLSSSLKVFQFSLTAVVSVSPSSSPPRLSSINTTATITIIDDEGGAGVFRLNPTTLTLAEGTTGSVNVVRSGNAAGRVVVQVETVDSGTATSGSDYQPFNTELVFGDGVSQLAVFVSALDDSIPENVEDFSILLSAPNSPSLIDTSTDTLTVVIDASDNPSGVFAFRTASLRLSDDGPTSGELEVSRIGSTDGEVRIMWEALYTDGEDHMVPLEDILVNTRGSITFSDNQATPDTNIQLQLGTNGVPEPGEQFSVLLSSLTPGVGFGSPVQAVVTVLPRVIATFRIAPNNLVNIVTRPESLPIVIERTEGLQITAQVSYMTLQATEPIVIGQLQPFQPALAQIQFTQIDQTNLIFNPGETSRTVDVPVISVGSIPAAFLVQIDSTTHQTVDATAVVIVTPPGVLEVLYSIYFQATSILTASDLEVVSSDLVDVLSNGLVSGQNDSQYDVIRITMEELITKSLLPDIDYSNTRYVPNMLDVFQSLVTDPSFTGRSLLVQIMKSFAYSQLANVDCNAPALAYSRPQLYMEAAKLAHSTLAGRRFSSSNGTDFIQFPTQIIAPQLDCMNVHYIELFTDSLFTDPTLQSKVLSAGIQGITLAMTSEPIIVRIHSNHNLGVIPSQEDCLLWEYPAVSGIGVALGNQWNEELCSPQIPLVLQEDFVQCECRQLGEMAVAADVEVGYGWKFPAGVSAAIVIIAMILVLILHLRFLARTQLETRILMCLCFSVLLFQLLLLVDIFASDDTEALSPDGCAALGGLLQFTAVAQFLWIAALAVALWIHFLGYLSGDEPLIIYIVNCWGGAMVVVVLTVVIGRYAVDFDLTSSEGLYGPVKDLCFMPLLPVSLVSTALPVVLSLLATVALVSYTCTSWSRWEDAKSMYQDSFNRREIPLLLILFGFIFLSSLACYLHVYIGLVYTFGAFIILNTLEGLYALLVYFFVSWHTLTRKHSKYNIGDEVEVDDVPPGEEHYQLGSRSLSFSTFASSKEQLIGKEFEDELNPSPDSGVIPIGMRRLHSNSDFNSPTKSSVPPPGEETKDDAHMDDLLFMLKTQNFSPGSVGSDESEPSMRRFHNPNMSGTEHFERRRISIADTHL